MINAMSMSLINKNNINPIQYLIKNCSLNFGYKDMINDIVKKDGIAKQGILIDESHFKMADNYADVITHDTNNYLYNIEGNPITIDLDTIKSNQGNQLFINKFTNRILFFDVPLLENSVCLIMAENFIGRNYAMDFNEVRAIDREDNYAVEG